MAPNDLLEMRPVDPGAGGPNGGHFFGAGRPAAARRRQFELGQPGHRAWVARRRGAVNAGGSKSADISAFFRYPAADDGAIRFDPAVARLAPKGLVPDGGGADPARRSVGNGKAVAVPPARKTGAIAASSRRREIGRSRSASPGDRGVGTAGAVARNVHPVRARSSPAAQTSRDRERASLRYPQGGGAALVGPCLAQRRRRDTDRRGGCGRTCSGRHLPVDETNWILSLSGSR